MVLEVLQRKWRVVGESGKKHFWGGRMGGGGWLVRCNIRRGGRMCSVWGNIINAGLEIDKSGVQFSNSSSKLVSVADRGEFEGGGWNWVWGWRRELGELNELNEALEGVLKEKVEEAGYKGRKCGPKTVWLKAVPKKVSIFMCRANLGRLSVRVELDRRGVDLNSVLCPRCEREVESVSHALFGCKKVKGFWMRVGRWWGLDVSSCNSLDEVVDVGRWVATILCLSYLLWSQRIKLVFKGGSGSLEEVLLNFQIKTFEWVNRRDPEIAVDWVTWMSNPSA
ncbi:hypothetical protein OSB04_025436 [Centaurea solstitialis]|uniref:Reverse transcriptase zinc-binding domain-containing protein n=1 Tax=Centaurea solstitialis TaxID=347529 RepID=A0AA38SN36_9ASTR|nr:hypothetical protein OSB04_025436 [Centaurea solstitialis]